MKRFIALFLAAHVAAFSPFCEAAAIQQQQIAVIQKKRAGGVTLPAPLLWWKLNDGSGTTITATNGPAGTTDADWITGKSGSAFALDFNGTSDEASSNAAVNYAGAGVITVAGWFYFDTTPTANLFESTANSDSEPQTFFAYQFSGKIYALCAEIAGNVRQESIPTPSTGAWHHLAFVFDTTGTNSNKGDVKIFLDGTEQTTTLETNTHDAATTFATQTFYLGSRGGTTNFFDGRIDDLRIYGRELTGAEITAVMNDPQ